MDDELTYDAKQQDQPGFAGHLKDWLGEHTDEIPGAVRIENDEHKGVMVVTVYAVEAWLDEMWAAYLEQYFPEVPEIQ